MDSPDGPGKVLQVNILKQNVVMRLDDESIMTYTGDELQQYIKPKTQQQPSQNRNKNSKRNDQRK
jgi:hypothetical protein